MNGRLEKRKYDLASSIVPRINTNDLIYLQKRLAVASQAKMRPIFGDQIGDVWWSCHNSPYEHESRDSVDVAARPSSGRHRCSLVPTHGVLWNRAGGFFWLSGDDAARMDLAYRWSEAPFFNLPGNAWPPLVIWLGLSGLSEPMFHFFMSVGVYFLLLANRDNRPRHWRSDRVSRRLNDTSGSVDLRRPLRCLLPVGQ